ncbi:hypothetical protein AJ79_07594 [Helicocarpus griseus UAMH5409]|uniref:Uncharacterized protein n=1 Tax=Helicocarpus griseus UAMH5409 TaxID=1447875 RepID=A0A2B7X177_9EURO|nr:hypothetical protein AJ79_07594 [Helicocarpus griseus UAMH5409]
MELRSEKQFVQILPRVHTIPPISSDPENPTGCEHAQNIRIIRNENDEQLVRTYHPLLRFSKVAFVCKDSSGRLTWLILYSPSSREYQNKEVAGRKVQVLSQFQSHNLSTSTGLYQGSILSHLNCKGELEADTIAAIRDFFPGAMSALVLDTRRVILMFPTRKIIRRCWATRVVEKVGEQMERIENLDYRDEYSDIIYEFTTSGDYGKSNRNINKAIRVSFPRGDSIIILIPQEVMQPLGIRGTLTGYCASASTVVQDYWQTAVKPRFRALYETPPCASTVTAIRNYGPQRLFGIALSGRDRRRDVHEVQGSRSPSDEEFVEIQIAPRSVIIFCWFGEEIC